MRKLHYLLLLATAAIVLGSCLDKQDVMPPVMTVTGDESSVSFFSTLQGAHFDVHIESGEDLKYFTIQTLPVASWTDTLITFGRYQHSADLKFDFKMNRGYRVVKDSSYTLTFTAYTADTSCVTRRRLRFKYIYPDVDSFDVEVGSDYNAPCLIDVQTRRVYKYTQYKNINYDLVYINDLEKRLGNRSVGLALCSPDALLLKDYFGQKFPDLPYNEENSLKRRTTICGYVTERPNDTDRYTSIMWSDFSNVMLAMDYGWASPCYLMDSPENNFGMGIDGLSYEILYKFQLQNGDYVMAKVLERTNFAYSNSTMKLRFFVQKK
ncbi:MAG: hypothetical protein MJZ66_05985 [Bacteroidales bacterium]|nr:hypothetical protein [Bacteroidales bacterium]